MLRWHKNWGALSGNGVARLAELLNPQRPIRQIIRMAAWLRCGPRCSTSC